MSMSSSSPPRPLSGMKRTSESTDQGSQQSNTLTKNTDQQVTQNNNSGSEQNVSTEQQNLAALPQRVTQNRGNSLQA